MNIKLMFRYLLFLIFISIPYDFIWAQSGNPFPGVVVFESTTNPIVNKVASPSITLLPNGDYLVSHDFKRGTLVHISKDKGKTWKQRSAVSPLIWATIFLHRGDVYLMGTSKGWGDLVIYRSQDYGETWSEPKDENSGLIAKGLFHTGPVPVVYHQGKLWRAYEEAFDLEEKRDFHALAICIDVDKDLLKAGNWKRTNSIRFDETWINAKRPNWLEGNLLVTPTGKLIDFMRLETWYDKDIPYALNGAAAGKNRHEVAAVIEIDEKDMQMKFDNKANNFVNFPGAETKFTIRYDSISKEYWTITNRISTFNKSVETYNGNWHQRNVLMLMSSKDLITWRDRKKLLKWNEGAQMRTWDTFGFQYVDWVMDKDDILFVSRTSWYGGRYHDANMITFDRIDNFRNTDLAVEPVDLVNYTQHPGLLSIHRNQLTQPSFNISNFDIHLDLGKGIVQLPNGSLKTMEDKHSVKNADEAVQNGLYFDIKITNLSKDFSLETLDFTPCTNVENVKLKWMYSVDGVTFHPITKYLIPVENVSEVKKPEPTLYLSVYESLRTINNVKGVILRCAFVGLNKPNAIFRFENNIDLGGRQL